MMPTGYNPEHFKALVEIEDRHFWFRARNRVLSAVVGDLASALPRPYRVLEVGCGNGNTLRMLEAACSGSALVGMDLFAEGLHYARQRSSALLVRGRLEMVPFKVRFHLVGMFDVLEHMEDDGAALANVYKLLETRGVLIVTVPAHQRLWSRFDEESHHYRRYELAELDARLKAAGFAVEYLTLFMAPLYPLARIGRKVSDMISNAKRYLGWPVATALANEIRIRPGINELLTRTLSAEAGLIVRRRRLPFGTSVLAVARRVP